MALADQYGQSIATDELTSQDSFGQRPQYLIRDHGSKYGQDFARVAAATGIEELRTAYRAPRQNAVCERFLGSVCIVYHPRDPWVLLHIVTPSAP